ncbi:G5 domain-containing protein [Neobacillus sp. 3P2-tot-E-2]|uniref:G5 domain-containing protein n=1 Tax=Neobacillus sp. 3P2-tot-E-2 TaxID=3132212 RepID=UPI0039A02B1F
MGKYKQVIKLFSVLFFCTAFIFSFSHYGAKAFETLTTADGKFSSGTSVGFVDLSGRSNSESITVLEEKYVEWIQNTKIEMQYSEKLFPIDVNLFQFDAIKTLKNIQDGQKNPASITIETQLVEEQIQILFPQIDTKLIDITKLTTDITNAVLHFESGSFVFKLNEDYLLSDAGQQSSVISEVYISLAENPNDLVTVLNSNSEISIAEEATFSLIEYAKQEKIETSSSLNVIATGIYQVILPTNILIMERNISNSLPEYSVLGLEANVNVAKGADLVFKNPNKTVYTLSFSLVNKNLKITLKGNSFLYDYKIIKENEQPLKPKTIVQYSPLILPRQIEVKNEGADGKLVTVYRDIFQGSQLVERQLISEDYYPPVYRVEVHGLTGAQKITTGVSSVSIGSTTDSTNSTGSQSQSTSDNTIQDSDDELWGKPNEQPK